MQMSKQLKVYNRFNELILYLQYTPGQLSFPLRVVLGSRELRDAVRDLYGHDFDRTAVINGQHHRFTAAWRSPEYLNTLAGYWASNLRWRTEITGGEIPVETQTRSSDFATEWPGLGGANNQLSLGGGLVLPYSNRFVNQSNLQARVAPDFFRLTYTTAHPGAPLTGRREPEESLPDEAFALSHGNTLSIPEASAEFGFGIATGAALQGGSPYGATFGAPG
jgi:hypothetical protein